MVTDFSIVAEGQLYLTNYSLKKFINFMEPENGDRNQ